MTQPLDPHTLRQAAARWPDQTLSKSAAQSFLRSLAQDAAAQLDDQPATADDPDRHAAAVALWPLATYRHPRPDELTDEQQKQWDRVTAALAAARGEQPPCTCYPQGFTPETYEGLQPWCDLHGQPSAAWDQGVANGLQQQRDLCRAGLCEGAAQ